jgi:hypothetical protein
MHRFLSEWLYEITGSMSDYSNQNVYKYTHFCHDLNLYTCISYMYIYILDGPMYDLYYYAILQLNVDNLLFAVLFSFFNGKKFNMLVYKYIYWLKFDSDGVP